MQTFYPQTNNKIAIPREIDYSLMLQGRTFQLCFPSVFYIQLSHSFSCFSVTSLMGGLAAQHMSKCRPQAITQLAPIPCGQPGNNNGFVCLHCDAFKAIRCFSPLESQCISILIQMALMFPSAPPNFRQVLLFLNHKPLTYFFFFFFFFTAFTLENFQLLILSLPLRDVLL